MNINNWNVLTYVRQKPMWLLSPLEVSLGQWRADVRSKDPFGTGAFQVTYTKMVQCWMIWGTLHFRKTPMFAYVNLNMFQN